MGWEGGFGPGHPVTGHLCCPLLSQGGGRSFCRQRPHIVNGGHPQNHCIPQHQGCCGEILCELLRATVAGPSTCLSQGVMNSGRHGGFVPNLSGRALGREAPLSQLVGTTGVPGATKSPSTPPPPPPLRRTDCRGSRRVPLPITVCSCMNTLTHKCAHVYRHT